ncbi:hypothetical protein [Micromonospora polyrhachis]|uniref:Uncharacterized protein n=1 Tax=Micromonospora polyrhachis TaxID=1282883 RepID=A0A7W7WT83_9ACTN|nr:hypothetical protein [Micromonospora polyrhachis]MBB4962208.1 hypothetical protein [Micromonospora polyrhachis]
MSGEVRTSDWKEVAPMDLAYLDAGSGSLIVQAVVGGVAGVAVATRLYWRRLVARFRKPPAANQQD